MPRFFTEVPVSGEIHITGDDASHISRSLRMKEGESLVACDTDGFEHRCVIRSIAQEEITLEVISSEKGKTEPPYRAVVYQSLVKGDKFDTVIQKAVECGASAIVPVLTSRATVRLTKADAEKKRVRWRRIAEESAKQCGRCIIPRVEAMLTFDEAIRHSRECEDISLFCYECEDKVSLRRAIGARDFGSVGIFIGPEGGYSPEEASHAAELGAVSVSLGRRILRTESAAPFVLSAVSYEKEV